MSSTTPTRSAGSKRSVSERRNVVLPAPVSPATRKFARACTSFASSSAISVDRPPSVTQSRPCRPPGSRSSRSRLNLRIERYGPPTGGMTAFTREPSAMRASTIGWATESSRPARAAIRSESSMSSRELPSRTSVDSRRPRRSTNTASGPFTRMSETSGSATSGCSGAESDDRRLDGCHESRRGREVKLRIVEDGFDRVAKGLLVVGCATEWIEDL